jgi:hypothetical protein
MCGEKLWVTNVSSSLSLTGEILPKSGIENQETKT